MAASAFIFSCSEDETSEPVFEYPLTLKATDYQIKSKIRMFTLNGEVTNQTLINSYIHRPNTETSDIWPDSIFFYTNTNTVVDVSTYSTITYTHKDTVIFPEPGEWGKRVLKKEQSYNHFYLADTLIGFKSGNNAIDNIVNNIGTYKPFYEDLPEYDDNLKYVRVFDAKIAKGNPEKLEFPNLIYKISRSNASQQFYTKMKHYNNIFDPTVIHQMQVGDTLIVQEVNIIYTKQ